MLILISSGCFFYYSIVKIYPLNQLKSKPVSVLSWITTDTTVTLYIYKTIYLGVGASYNYDDYFINYAKVNITDENNITYNFIPGETTYPKNRAYLSESTINFQAGKKYFLNIKVILMKRKFQAKQLFQAILRLQVRQNMTLKNEVKRIELNIKWTKSHAGLWDTLLL